MPLRVIPVLDLKDGRAVHAIGGHRTHYRPLTSGLHEGSEPIALARALRDQLGLRQLYLADLDAIGGGALNLEIYQGLAEIGLCTWVDAGVRDLESLPPLLEARIPTIVVGLETVQGPAALGAIVEAIGVERLVFSLDLRDGTPLTPDGANWSQADPLGLAEEALSLGVRRILLLDLARVGRGQGIGTEPLLKHLAFARPDVELTVGGGVSNAAEVRALMAAGASAVLVGSALHDGRIGLRDLTIE